MDINAERALYYLDNHNAHHHQKDEEHPPTSTKNVLELWQTCVIKFIINNAIKIKLNRNYFRFVTQSSSFPPILLLGLCVLTNGPPPALCIVGNIPGIPGAEAWYNRTGRLFIQTAFAPSGCVLFTTQLRVKFFLLLPPLLSCMETTTTSTHHREPTWAILLLACYS